MASVLMQGGAGQKSPCFRVSLLTVLLLIGIAEGRAQALQEDYAHAERLLPWNAKKLAFKLRVAPNWIEKGDRFWYRNDTRNGKEFVLVDPEQNTREMAFDHKRLAAALSRVTGKEYTAKKLPFESFEFVDAGRTIRFEAEQVRWQCDLANDQCTCAESAEGELISPDGRLAAYVKGDNLYVRRVGTQEEIALTIDGQPYYNYATSPDARTTAVADKLKGRKLPPVAIWSSDSKKLVTHRLDQRQVKELYLIQSVLPADGARPVLHSYRYPLVGDAHQPMAELVIFDLQEKTAVWIDTPPLLAPYRSPIETKEVWWSEDNGRIYFLSDERGQKGVQMYVANTRTGQSRPILEEHAPTYVELNLEFLAPPNVRSLGGAEVVWFSERDGWAHLYLYDEKKGALKNQITLGPWVVRDLLRVDEQARQVYFTAGGREKGRDPYYRHLYRVNLDGSNLQLLTPEDADHEIHFSPSGRYFVDTYSRIDLAPTSLLRSADGTLIRKVEEADLELLLGTGWKWPERFTVKARDGVTDIYGAIFRPSYLDPSKKYPVIDDIYPGPQIIRTAKKFGAPSSDFFSAGQEFWFWHPQALAELGFIVVTIDGLGTSLRSKAFHTAYYGKMGDAGGLEDHVAGLKQLAARYSYMDMGRVGIFGHSGGGFATARAMLAYPDFYKVGVSSAGNHDQSGYLAAWGEKYQGFLAGDNYSNQANPLLAGNLKGKLLLAWGDLDDNVHPALTIQLVDALIKANKDFDLLLMPNRHHDFLRDPYFVRRLWDYFVKNLQGREPPGYRIQEPPQE